MTSLPRHHDSHRLCAELFVQESERAHSDLVQASLTRTPNYSSKRPQNFRWYLGHGKVKDLGSSKYSSRGKVGMAVNSNSRNLSSNYFTFSSSPSTCSDVLGRLERNTCLIRPLPTAFECVLGNAVLIS